MALLFVTCDKLNTFYVFVKLCFTNEVLLAQCLKCTFYDVKKKDLLACGSVVLLISHFLCCVEGNGIMATEDWNSKTAKKCEITEKYMASCFTGCLKDPLVVFLFGTESGHA